MKATNLQSLISANASFITDLHTAIAYANEQVKYWDGVATEVTTSDTVNYNQAISLEYHFNTERKKMKTMLTKAVDVQKDLKAELAFMSRMVRIDRGLTKLESVNAFVVVPDNITSHELEAVVKAKLNEVFPPKPDSRVK